MLRKIGLVMMFFIFSSVIVVGFETGNWKCISEGDDCISTCVGNHIECFKKPLCDCDIEIDDKDEEEDEIIELESLEINIQNFKEFFTNSRINVGFTANQPVRVFASENGREKRLCSNCKSYNRQMSFREGKHEVKFEFSNGEETLIEVYNFSVDSRKPRFFSVIPRRGYSNGNFLVSYKEDNLENISMFYNVDGEMFEMNNKCDEGLIVRRRQACEFNIGGINGEISYFFRLNDKGFSVDSRKYGVVIDNDNPEVELLNYDLETRRLRVELSEKSSIKYIDHSSRRPRFRGICNKCDFVSKKLRFRKGIHKLEFEIKDLSGNIVTKNLVVEIA